MCFGCDYISDSIVLKTDCTLSVPILYHPPKGLQTEPYKIKNPPIEKVPKYTGLRRSVQNHLETSLQSPQ